MLHKTRGICIKFFRYRETSIIAKIYTEEFGLQSYLINSVRTEKPKFGIALFQPLTLLDMVVYHKPAKSVLQRVAEIRCRKLYQTIPYEVKKTSLAIFLSEILLKTLHEEEQNKKLYDFLEQFFIHLDTSEQIDNLALRFLLHFLEQQGFLGERVKYLFEELYQNKLCPSPEKLHQEIIHLENIRSGVEVELPNLLRQQLVNYLLAYFGLHYDFLGEVKSLQILRSIF